jgi:hypothetical protein
VGIGTWRICCCTELRELDEFFFFGRGGGGELDFLLVVLWYSVIY